MTADWYHMDYALLGKIANRIINEVRRLLCRWLLLSLSPLSSPGELCVCLFLPHLPHSHLPCIDDDCNRCAASTACATTSPPSPPPPSSGSEPTTHHSVTRPPTRAPPLIFLYPAASPRRFPMNRRAPLPTTTPTPLASVLQTMYLLITLNTHRKEPHNTQQHPHT
jgi:hypothetical protein